MRKDIQNDIKLVNVNVDQTRQNKDKCSCEYKELIDKGICDTRFI